MAQYLAKSAQRWMKCAGVSQELRHSIYTQTLIIIEQVARVETYPELLSFLIRPNISRCVNGRPCRPSGLITSRQRLCSARTLHLLNWNNQLFTIQAAITFPPKRIWQSRCSPTSLDDTGPHALCPKQRFSVDAGSSSYSRACSKAVCRGGGWVWSTCSSNSFYSP